MLRDLGGMRPFLSRLSAAFGWQYVSSCILVYGVNQGLGEKFVFGARSYFMLDEVGMTSAEYGRVAGFSHIPWQLKSLFGLLSDVVPLAGRHRGPYMLIAGVSGVIALCLLTALPKDLLTRVIVGCLFLLVNINFAMPDVMIDATVAERCKVRPELGAELQALCWGSMGLIGIPAAALKGYLLIAYGPRMLFGLSILAALAVIVPPCCGWLGERVSHAKGGCLHESRQLCASVWAHATKRAVAVSAGVVGGYSITLGVVQLVFGQQHPNAVQSFTFFGNFALACVLYRLLARVGEYRDVGK